MRDRQVGDHCHSKAALILRCCPLVVFIPLLAPGRTPQLRPVLIVAGVLLLMAVLAVLWHRTGAARRARAVPQSRRAAPVSPVLAGSTPIGDGAVEPALRVEHEPLDLLTTTPFSASGRWN